MLVRAAIVAAVSLSALANTDATTVVVTRTGASPNAGVRATLSSAPILVDGSFLVPARQLFEALGISVRARGNDMTATAVDATTARSIVIAMHVGKPEATVDGAVRPVSPAPALVAGTLYVPLRFVAVATGAAVRYDPAQRTIYLSLATARASGSALPPPPVPERLPETEPPATPEPATPQPEPTPLPTPTPVELPTPSIVLRLVREEPARGTTVDRERPEISASFGEPVAGSTVRIVLDGREITSDATVTNRYFIYEPPADLAAGTHEIDVGGRTALHEAFADRWSFESAAAKGHNFLAGVEPPSGIPVTSPLVVSGITKPRSRVGMVATSSETAAHFSELSGGAYTDHTISDAKGTFEFRLDLVDRGSGFLDIRLDSTAPDGAVAVKTLRLRL